MKNIILRAVLGLVLLLGFCTPVRADINVTGAYTILASEETAKNTTDGQPLQITFDVEQNHSTVTVNNILTNSACANNTSNFRGGVVTKNVNGSLQTISFTSNVDTSVFTFTTKTSTFTSTGGGCSQGDGGNFTLSIIPSLQGTYSGTLEGNDGTNNGTSGIPTNITFQTNTSTFSLAGTTINISARLCAAGPTTENLTVNSAADSVGGFSSVQSGNVLLFNATDGVNTIGFIGTPTGADGNTSAPGAWYITYFVESGACTGSQGVDAPFVKVSPRFIGRPFPIRIREWRNNR